MSGQRMTTEQRERIRTFLQRDWLMRDGESALTYARELFDELDAVTREREERGRMVDNLAFKIDEIVRRNEAAAGELKAEAEKTRGLLLSLVASLTLCDHMGDVGDDIFTVLKKLGEPWSVTEWSGLDELREALAKHGIRTLYGTDLSSGDEDEDS